MATMMKEEQPKLGGPVVIGTRRANAIVWLLQSKLGHGLVNRDLERISTGVEGCVEYIYLDGEFMGEISTHYKNGRFTIDAQVGF